MTKTKKVPKFYLKDILFNRGKVEGLSREIYSVFKKFEREKFVEEVMEKFPELELKQRIYHIRDILFKYLPPDYLSAIRIIEAALPKELDNTLGDGDFGDFIHAPYAEYVAKYGLEKRYLTQSLKLLEEITKRFSVEYAIRHFLNFHKKETLNWFKRWSKSKHYHVRRLASEGSRPRLPWGINVNLDYKETEKFLDNLFLDKTRYVTRSVANHLNDISKIDPDFVYSILKKWQGINLKLKGDKKQSEKEMQFIINHATRTLRKKT